MLGIQRECIPQKYTSVLKFIQAYKIFHFYSLLEHGMHVRSNIDDTEKETASFSLTESFNKFNLQWPNAFSVMPADTFYSCNPSGYPNDANLP